MSQELKECQALFLDGTPVPEEDGDDDDGDEDYEGGRGGVRGGGRGTYVSPRAKRSNMNRIVW